MKILDWWGRRRRQEEELRIEKHKKVVEIINRYPPGKVITFCGYKMVSNGFTRPFGPAFYIPELFDIDFTYRHVSGDIREWSVPALNIDDILKSEDQEELA